MNDMKKTWKTLIWDNQTAQDYLYQYCQDHPDYRARAEASAQAQRELLQTLDQDQRKRYLALEAAENDRYALEVELAYRAGFALREEFRQVLEG